MYIMQGRVEAPVLCRNMVQYTLWKVQKEWKTEEWEIWFGGKGTGTTDSAAFETLQILINMRLQEIQKLGMELEPGISRTR